MMKRDRQKPQLKEIVTFWFTVVIVALVLGALAFAAGKFWVGGLIAQNSGNTAPAVTVKTPEEETAPKTEETDSTTEPPAKAVVKLEQREPTEAEKSELEQKYPQDGASLPGSGGPDDSKGGDAKALDDNAKEGEYVVRAGSYVNPDNAQKYADELADKGYSTEIRTVTVKGKKYHRVLVGPYTDKSEAEVVRDDLVQSGFEASVRTR